MVLFGLVRDKSYTGSYVLNPYEFRSWWSSQEPPRPHPHLEAPGPEELPGAEVHSHVRMEVEQSAGSVQVDLEHVHDLQRQLEDALQGLPRRRQTPVPETRGFLSRWFWPSRQRTPDEDREHPVTEHAAGATPEPARQEVHSTTAGTPYRFHLETVDCLLNGIEVDQYPREFRANQTCDILAFHRAMRLLRFYSQPQADPGFNLEDFTTSCYIHVYDLTSSLSSNIQFISPAVRLGDITFRIRFKGSDGNDNTREDLRAVAVAMQPRTLTIDHNRKIKLSYVGNGV